MLKKALDCFWKKGYEATSTRDLAKAMGISYGSVYNTFRDKRTLYLAALDLYISSYADTVVEEIDRATSARTTLTQLLEQTVEASATDASGCFAGNAILSLAHRDAEVARKVRAMNKTIEQAIERLLTRAQQAGEIDLNHDPTDVAYFIINTLSGIRLTARLSRDQSKLQRMAKVALSVL